MAKLNPMTTLAQNIRDLMRAKGLRQEDLAERSGIERPNISRLLTSKTANPQLSTLTAIASALGVRVSDLFDESRKKVAC